jgi:hypothetical protein
VTRYQLHTAVIVYLFVAAVIAAFLVDPILRGMTRDFLFWIGNNLPLFLVGWCGFAGILCWLATRGR